MPEAPRWCNAGVVPLAPRRAADRRGDGPIGMNAAHMFGMCFSTINTATGKIERAEACDCDFGAAAKEVA